MEVRTTVATSSSAIVAWDPRMHAIHVGSSDVGRSKLSRVVIVRVKARTGVGDEDGIRACPAMCVG
eukprot:3244914-Pleurochrysis_carterae.AAC.1